jgi:1-deoxy-D-xylulose-5-phosphate synthase
MERSFLNTRSIIRTPQSLRRLKPHDLVELSRALRQELIAEVLQSGGHFASSLGATELTVALHYSFETPHDRLVWDVGHQAYIHKMLTGRRSRLKDIRQEGGPSGFLKRSESEYDCFGAGHAGTSLSAALGIRQGLDRLTPERFVVAVIGDGGLTAGMALEAMNHIGELSPQRFIVVLNDNEMSISANVGALHQLCSTGDPAGFFASLGFRYIGPVDGHDFRALLPAVERAKSLAGPVLLHVKTIKGKGHAAAEHDPTVWHGISPAPKPIEKQHGSPVSESPPPTYTAVFADTLVSLAQSDPRIVAITAAMPGGTGLDRFQKVFPESYFDVGIAEQHAVTLAAGMAAEGLRPVCALYSTFLQRAYDQLIHDVCIQNLPVVFAVDRAGAVGNDGETHQGVFDISAFRPVPGLCIMSPKDEAELQSMLATAVQHSGPTLIRYPRGHGRGVPLSPHPAPLEIGRAEILRQGSDGLLVAFGPLASLSCALSNRMRISDNLQLAVINARFAKPLDEELLCRELPKYPFVCSLEDHSLAGGFGTALLELIHDRRLQMKARLERRGIGDFFLPHTTQEGQHRLCGLDFGSLAETIRISLCRPRRKKSAGG